MRGDRWQTHPRGRRTTICEDLPNFKWIRRIEWFGDMILGTHVSRVFFFFERARLSSGSVPTFRS